MTGMDEMPDWRPLTLGGWPGKGVSAGDKGKLLYTQHTGSAAKECKGRGAKKTQKKQQFHSKKASMAISPFEKSFCSSCCFNVPFHAHYSLPNVPLHP